MSFKKIVIPVSLAAMLAVGAPAFAQRGGGHGGGGGHFGGGGGHFSGGGHYGGGHAGGGPRGGYGGGHVGGQGGPRGGFNHGGFGHDGHFGHVRFRHGFHGGFFGFRPRFDLGFGLFIGYPFAYPWDYIEAYPYYPYYPYAYAPYGPADPAVEPADPDDGGSAAVPQDDNNAGPTTDDMDSLRHYGGMSLDITPDDASVFVDNDYAGPVKNYGPAKAPLTLAPGPHRVVISKPGYRTWTFTRTCSKIRCCRTRARCRRAIKPSQIRRHPIRRSPINLRLIDPRCPISLCNVGSRRGLAASGRPGRRGGRLYGDWTSDDRAYRRKTRQHPRQRPRTAVIARFHALFSVLVMSLHN